MIRFHHEIKSSFLIFLSILHSLLPFTLGFTPDKVPRNLDAIVIGSGIGGLACAGIMARAGKKVLVLEQHDRAGGCTHTYEEKGFEFDIGKRLRPGKW